ncbi:valine--tRNA ligase [Candidatus Daviesbacteria bacterium RIFCSPHIGHO2_02_FULL_36_13]|uniref:Valine--tRNA ligase n=1 Tax=Candidatus Daviesbacteria bacterium RIFCSPHIGHO2_02_FULL_36_13 TaxID=1797768 RepID=A0A1F5JRM6_9BACT|nr:MAG: valine--tRNA ligase [Candidatus Daviesbacteria bacterium RIFCSPHIGHO2_02_FULL_36_13]OGE44173.1 MAG: valine--tRNA ligase [Candidatus Daviesbacteria bacterium RIFCSPLOWO2_01_FULL_36_8]
MDEQKWYQFWEDSGFFKADPSSSKKPYGLLMPPPNVTGALHLGHAMEHSILDAIARFKRMQGFDVLLLPGVDHAGIQFEGTLNKLLEKEGLNKGKLGREEWLKRAWAFKDESYKSVSATWRVMGLSADWSREIFTLDPKVQKAVLHEFKTFFEEGLLYKGAYIVQWCPKDQTAIEAVEMEYEEKKEKLYFVKFKIQDSDEFITVATTRPETISADPAIAIFPGHPKFKHLVGKTAINPFTKAEMQIIEDKRIDKNFGTGALKVTPGHALLDYEIGKDHNLPILHAVDKTGRITDLDPNLKGMKASEARIKAGEILEEMGALEKVEDLTHSVPVCERCKTMVEPLVSEEFFVKMKPLGDKALTRIDEVNFIPKNYGKILADWIKEVHDWCISRPLWWGYRIPVWYCQKCNPGHEVGKDKQSLGPDGPKDMIIAFDHPTQNCQTCKLNEWVQDEKLLDTWFSSGLWPMATLGWPDQTEEFKKYFPWDFETSAGEIKYLWIARMIMLSLHFTDQIPFKNMFFHGMIRDLQGRKFSKSLNNGIDPNELRKQWGTDAVRMALYTYSAPGRDGRANKQTMDERAKNFRNFSTKLTNIARFIVDLKPTDVIATPDLIRGKQSQNKDDQDIIEKLNQTISKVTKNIDKFELHLATETLYNFIWHDLADVYIEKTKTRRAEAQPTLEYVFKISLELLHPFMPFITEELWQKMPHEGKSIMVTAWPVPGLNAE